MLYDDRTVVLSEVSANGRWLLSVQKVNITQYLLADVQYIGNIPVGCVSYGMWFGPYGIAPDADISIRLLPDNVAGFYVDDNCYAMFRCGAARRRNRPRSCANSGPFTEDEIAYFCARTHLQYRKPPQV